MSLHQALHVGCIALSFVFCSCSSTKFESGNGSDLSSRQSAPEAPILENQNGKATIKGSFTVTTVPNNPAPGQPYEIVIMVNYGSQSLESTLARDLELSVVGSDSFSVYSYNGKFCFGASQGFYLNRGCDLVSPRDIATIEPSLSQFKSGTLRLRIPGAAYKVRDRIEVRSIALNEKQSFTIEF